jgi:uncharacterized protein (DUF2147 family)
MVGALRLHLVISMLLALGVVSALADPIEGKWRTMDASVARISACTDGFCIGLLTGEHAGREIGALQPKGDGKYDGEVIDPRDDRRYTGRAEVHGDELKLSGCALKIFCQTEVWSRITD